MIQKKEENGEKYVTATTEAEFHEALNRGFAVEVTRKLADEIGVPMNEHVGTVAEIDAGAERPSRLGMEPPAMTKKSFWRRGEDDAKKVSSEIIDQIKRGDAPWQKPWKPGELLKPMSFELEGRDG